MKKIVLRTPPKNVNTPERGAHWDLSSQSSVGSPQWEDLGTLKSEVGNGSYLLPITHWVTFEPQFLH